MILTLGSLPGYALVAVLADWWGRKAMFALFFAGAALSAPMIFLGPWTLSQMLLLLPFLGFFTLGIYAGFPIYLPELFPTHLRTTGAGFCFNVGRVVSAAGPFLTGVVVLYTGSIRIRDQRAERRVPARPGHTPFCKRDEGTAAAVTRSG